MDKITLAGQNGKLSFHALHRPYHGSTDYWDANWINFKVMVQLPKLVCELKIDLRTDDFESLLNQRSSSDISFRTLEEGVFFEVIESEKALRIKGYLDGEDGRVTFNILTDSSKVSSFLEDVEMFIIDNPVIGSPND